MQTARASFRAVKAICQDKKMNRRQMCRYVAHVMLFRFKRAAKRTASAAVRGIGNAASYVVNFGRPKDPPDSNVLPTELWEIPFPDVVEIPWPTNGELIALSSMASVCGESSNTRVD